MLTLLSVSNSLIHHDSAVSAGSQTTFYSGKRAGKLRDAGSLLFLVIVVINIHFQQLFRVQCVCERMCGCERVCVHLSRFTL